MIKVKNLEIQNLSSKTPNKAFEVWLIASLDNRFVCFLQIVITFAYEL